MSARGFTLFEVLVALAIAGLMLAVLMRQFSTGFEAIGRAGNAADAALLAESTLETVGADGPPADGVVTDRVGDYARRVVVAPYQPPDASRSAAPPALRAYRIEVTVSWPFASPKRSVRLRTIRLAGGP